MKHTIIAIAVLWLCADVCVYADSSAPKYEQTARFLVQHCVQCHGQNDPDGAFSVEGLGEDFSRHREDYARILERLRAGDMPPPKEPRPSADAVKQASQWIEEGLKRPIKLSDSYVGLVRPNEGNRVPHSLLFEAYASEVVPPPARLWRMRPSAYKEGFVRSLRSNGSDSLLTQPFDLVPDPGIKDYAALYSLDSVGTEVLLRNAQHLVDGQTRHKIEFDAKGGPDGRVSMSHDTVGDFAPLLHPKKPPTKEELAKAFVTQFRLSIVREPTEQELARLFALYETNRQVSDHVAAAKATLMAPLLMPEAVFRFELGSGSQVRPGVRMLSSREIAFAVSLALSDRREETIFQAAKTDKLTTREAVAEHVDRILKDERFPKPRLVGFFREFFGYDNCINVFKDPPSDHVYRPQVLVKDTDYLVEWVLKQDKDVLRELLTTRKTFANYHERRERDKVEIRPAEKVNPHNDPGRKAPEYAYGFKDWPSQQPAERPDGAFGILMQPSWLAAWSGNFDNDPIRRGRWIRERLLGGSVPDLPIGVVAKIPDEPDQPLRHRFRVTRDTACWTCHQKMDDLGLPFENFTHFGVQRPFEEVLDLEATAKHVDKKGKPLGPIKKQLVLNTEGEVAFSGERTLDGAVKDPYELMKRLADSHRVRQVFIRHAFRFYLGRNETPGDAKTLQDADQAYVNSGGSFNALLVSLLSSESFLYRATPAPNLEK